MTNYTWVLFDADDTLFHFDAYNGLKRTFIHYGIDFTSEHYHEYEVINQALWIEYQNGSIDAHELQCKRFIHWAEQLQCSPHDLNSSFLAEMAEICTPIEGAVSLLNTLKNKVKLGIITNGFTELQQTRLERTGLQHHFELVVISEQVGFAKPHQGIFDHALAIMGHPEREQVLMVGDNPASDIVGGINAGFHTCWLNSQDKVLPEGVLPTYQVKSLSEIEALFVRGKKFAMDVAPISEA